MTRRIAIAILLTTWTALIAIGVTVYLATRHVLLTDLDASVVARAASLPDALRVPGATAAENAASVPEGDRFIIRNAVGRTLARPATAAHGATPVVMARAFSRLGDGSRVRTLTLVIGEDDASNADKRLVVTYSASAARFDHLLGQLLMWLIASGIVCGCGAAAAAVVLSRIALRPLRQTADVIGAIDERQLARRIEADSLPPELRPMAGRLNEMLARLETSFEERRRFLAAASHELRTPVAAILTTIEVALRRPRGAEEMTESLRACLPDAKVLRQLVDWLMQQVRSESPSLSEPRQRFDAVALLEECADAALRAAGDRPITIRRHLPERLDVYTETNRLRSIIMNLLGNAMEYGRADGQIELRCEVTGDAIIVRISDDGPGIAEELLPRLFEPFSRGDARQAADIHLGLGLSLVQAHARALGGRCEVQSAVGAGSTFIVRLPCSILASPDQLVA
ncbi:MAG TPA: ATP-binding protein [Tepidisphaeraceae bacterium]|nr:ATP-binding protein [Tepidisphaeraceae bacterium]